VLKLTEESTRASPSGIENIGATERITDLNTKTVQFFVAVAVQIAVAVSGELSNRCQRSRKTAQVLT
jgi:hypothetical protein